MASPFVAEIRIFPFNFAPTGWAMCDGQLLPISQNTALFSLLGTYYGGDGKSTFALPDLNGSLGVHCGGTGAGPGLQQWFLGQQEGEEFVTLIDSEMAAHSHPVVATTTVGTVTGAGGNQPARGFAGNIQNSTSANWYCATAPNTSLAFQSVGLNGGSLPHNNMMPYLTLNFCIAMQGIFPPRG
jgi:microcystin-dependent protein